MADTESKEYLLVKSANIVSAKEQLSCFHGYSPALIIMKADWDTGAGPFLGEFVFVNFEISDLQYYSEEGLLGALLRKDKAEIIAEITGDNIKWG